MCKGPGVQRTACPGHRRLVGVGSHTCVVEMETEVWLTFRLYILNDMENHGKLSDRKEPICVPKNPRSGETIPRTIRATGVTESSQGAESW